MSRKLTRTASNALRQRHRQERDGRIRDRIKAVLAHDEGYSYADIARMLLLDDETIRRHDMGNTISWGPSSKLNGASVGASFERLMSSSRPV